MNKHSSIAGRHRNQLAENWVSHRRSMLESPAWRVLSRGARQFLDRLEIEHMAHGGRENGKLPLTYQDLIAYGMTRAQIAPAMREAEALGFAICTKRGRGGNADSRAPNLWWSTYVQNVIRNNVSSALPTDEWQKIKTIADAEAIAAAARAKKDPLRVAFGRRQKNKNRYQKQTPAPVLVSDTEIVSSPVSETDITGSVRKLAPLSISRVGGRGRGGLAGRSKPRTSAPHSAVVSERLAIGLDEHQVPHGSRKDAR
jgi:hypothetical protein